MQGDETKRVERFPRQIPAADLKLKMEKDMKYGIISTRHATWDTLCDLILKLSHKYGGTAVDSEANKSWDWGQAITREMYGVDWNNDPEFNRVSQLSDTEAVPPEAIEIAKRWLAGDLSSWIVT